MVNAANLLGYNQPMPQAPLQQSTPSQASFQQPLQQSMPSQASYPSPLTQSMPSQASFDLAQSTPSQANFGLSQSTPDNASFGTPYGPLLNSLTRPTNYTGVTDTGVRFSMPQAPIPQSPESVYGYDPETGMRTISLANAAQISADKLGLGPGGVPQIMRNVNMQLDAIKNDQPQPFWSGSPYGKPAGYWADGGVGMVNGQSPETARQRPSQRPEQRPPVDNSAFGVIGGTVPRPRVDNDFGPLVGAMGGQVYGDPQFDSVHGETSPFTGRRRQMANADLGWKGWR